MRTALKSRSAQHGPVVDTATMPSPVGGWNARDSLADMQKTDAVTLDNWMPKSSYVELRGGYLSHSTESATDIDTEDAAMLATEDGFVLATEDTATTMLGTVKTLVVHNGLTGVNQLLAMTEQAVYNVTTAGATSSALLTRTNGKHQSTMFGDGTTQWLIALNGVDLPLYYDGTTALAVTQATSPALTGFPANDLTQLISVTAFKSRLFFIPKSSLSFWYLPVSVAGGALTEFDLSSQATKGGYLMAMGTWTRDAGNGQDDIAVFVTSEGEAILYQGNNPSNVNSWSKVGSFFVGKPLGRRCLTQYGEDLLILTENGIFPLSSALPSASVDYRYALSFKIDKAFTDSARVTGDVFGWESTVFPAQQALIVNVPVAEDGVHYQYVMNTLTKSWCRFTAWGAETFAVFNKELYFARGGFVYRAWTGNIDDTDNIEGYAKQAFSHFGKPGKVKTFKLFRPILAVNGSLNYSTDIDVDFQDDVMIAASSASTAGLATWNQSQWNQARWGGGFKIVKPWTSIAEWPGTWAAGKLKVSTNSRSVQWMASDFIFETGQIL